MLLVAALAGCSPARHPRPVVSSAPPARHAGAVPSPRHVVVVVFENADASAVIGSPKAPYLNSLAAHGALFTNSHAIAHPSQPNYLALYSGSTHGVTSDACPERLSGPTLAGELQQAGLSFTGYAEDLPHPGYTGCQAGGYARKHAPWVDFPQPPGTVGVPYSAFPERHYAQLPTVAFVIPNLCHDMHDCPVAAGDTWLRSHLSGYRQWVKNHDSLLIVTFDEAENSQTNRIMTLAAGPMVTPGRYHERIDHYRLLATLEDFYHLPRAGHSAQRRPITDAWVRSADGGAH
jgi:acid phosphatase